MTDTTVKAGQVWQSKNSGARWTVTEDGEAWVGVTRSDGLTAVVQKAHLTADAVLVKDAP